MPAKRFSLTVENDWRDMPHGYVIAELLQLRIVHTPDDTTLTVMVAGFGFSLTRWAV